jgi:glutamate synthase domain-containing protein 2
VTLGTRFAKKPIELKIPITIAGMSFGARRQCQAGARPRRHRGRDQYDDRRRRMSEEERSESKILVYQVLPSRYGFDPSHLRASEAVEIVVG